MAESFVQVNNATSPGKKMATFEFLNGGGDTVESEAVTLADSDGNELLGERVKALSIPVTIASDQIVTVAPPAAVIGVLTQFPASLVAVDFLPTDLTRVGFTIYNRSDTDFLYLLLASGGPVSLTFFTVILQPNTYYEDPFRYTGPVSGIWETTTFVGAQALVNVYKP